MAIASLISFFAVFVGDLPLAVRGGEVLDRAAEPPVDAREVLLVVLVHRPEAFRFVLGQLHVRGDDELLVGLDLSARICMSDEVWAVAGNASAAAAANNTI